MGTSFVRYRGVGFWARDGILEVWLALLAREVDAGGDAPDWLRALGGHWQTQVAVGFVGCIDADLDTLVTDDASREELIRLTTRALDRIREAAPFLSESLQSSPELPDRSHSHSPAAPFLRCGRAFRALLDTRITTDARAAPPGGPTEEFLAEVEGLVPELCGLNPDRSLVPLDFDHPRALARARALHRTLVEVLGGAIGFFDGAIQDATYHAFISIPAFGGVRLSNFGDAATLTGEEKFPAEVLDAVIGALARHRHRFVPFAVFGLPFEERERINGDLFNQLFDYV